MKKLREKGLSYRAIGKELGISYETVRLNFNKLKS